MTPRPGTSVPKVLPSLQTVARADVRDGLRICHGMPKKPIRPAFPADMIPGVCDKCGQNIDKRSAASIAHHMRTERHLPYKVGKRRQRSAKRVVNRDPRWYTCMNSDDLQDSYAIGAVVCGPAPAI